MATHSIHTCAKHNNFTLECDVYSPSSVVKNSHLARTVILYFHSGGLVNGSRHRIPPWLIQAAVFERGWTLVSPSYRLLPQIGGNELLQDTLAAYRFAQSWGLEPCDNGDSEVGTRQMNRVIASGGSAGFFLATLIAHHAKASNLAPPAALLSLTGITTHRHPSFNSSVQLMPKPIEDVQMEDHIAGPVQIGIMHPSERAYFSLAKLLPSGNRSMEYNMPPPAPPPIPTTPDDHDEKLPRGCLYDYFLFNNQFISLVGKDVDVGFEYLTEPQNADKLHAWPTTIFIHADADEDVSPAVTTDIAKILGEEKARVFTAKKEGHLFNETWYLEDGDGDSDEVTEGEDEETRERERKVRQGMKTVQDALKALDQALGS